jgi:hypothetical protein
MHSYDYSQQSDDYKRIEKAIQYLEANFKSQPFVTFEAMTPGEFKKQGAGLEIFYGFCDSPFGDCLLAITERGICHLGFVKMENKIISFLNQNYKETAMHKICCRHEPQLEKRSLIINVCAGCDRRFGSLYEGISTISLWEIIDGLDSFAYPDYKGLKMSVHDPCPVRKKPPVHQAVRNLLENMNIEVVETKFSGTLSVCCGDDFYPKLPVDKVHNLFVSIVFQFLRFTL